MATYLLQLCNTTAFTNMHVHATQTHAHTHTLTHTHTHTHTHTRARISSHHTTILLTPYHIMHYHLHKHTNSYSLTQAYMHTRHLLSCYLKVPRSYGTILAIPSCPSNDIKLFSYSTTCTNRVIPVMMQYT